MNNEYLCTLQLQSDCEHLVSRSPIFDIFADFLIVSEILVEKNKISSVSNICSLLCAVSIILRSKYMAFHIFTDRHMKSVLLHIAIYHIYAMLRNYPQNIKSNAKLVKLSDV